MTNTLLSKASETGVSVEMALETIMFCASAGMQSKTKFHQLKEAFKGSSSFQLVKRFLLMEVKVPQKMQHSLCTNCYLYQNSLA